MKIAYFTPYPVKVSETFFAFLIEGLAKKLGPGEFLHVVGSSRGPRLIQNTFFSGFVLNIFLLRLLYEFHDRMKHRVNWAQVIVQRYASSKLSGLDGFGKPDVAYVEYGTTAIRVYKFLAAKKIPFVVHFHGKDASAEFNSWTYRMEMRQVFDASAFIITASHHIRRLLILRGCDPDKIRVIRLGIDINKVVPMKWDTRKKSGPSVVFLGRLTEKKNPIALLHAFKMVKHDMPEARLTMIGDGKLRDQVTNLIDKLDLNTSVSMLGAMDHTKALEIMNSHWVFASHNVTAVDGDQEGYVLAPAEAAALGIPVVSTYHNGIPEHVIQGKTGFLVKEYDYESMAKKILVLLKNPNLAEEMGSNGRNNISKINDPGNRIAEVLSLLAEASIIPGKTKTPI